MFLYFFLCVKTNFGHAVVAHFILHDEDSESIARALNILKQQNSDWNPAHFIVDYALPEMNAIESIFPGFPDIHLKI